ncbi:MAG: VCBS repeat-containing protein [Caldilineales bacterium]|nr:VCBS repeat-containing protein [Caldilineales bacterium]
MNNKPHSTTAKRTIIAGAMTVLVMALAACQPLATSERQAGVQPSTPISAAAPPSAVSTDTAPLPPPARFVDVAVESGIDFRQGAFRWGASGDAVAMMGGGLCWIDYDQDGWLDLFVVNSYTETESGRWDKEMDGKPTSALYRNQGDGSFVDVSVDTGAGLALRGNGCVAADFNNDGWPDLYITTARFSQLLWNNAGTGFVEGAEAAGVDAYGWHTAASAGDMNGDDLLDLFVAGYVNQNRPLPYSAMGFPNTHYGERDKLYINQGIDDSGFATFREVGEIVGLETDQLEYGLGASLTDFDGDSDLDLFVANDTNPNRLYENMTWPGGKEADPEGIGFRLAEVGQFAEVNDRNSGMGVGSADYDGDGRFDLFITNMGPQLHSVYRHDAATPMLFDDASENMGVAGIGVGWTGWGVSFADVDQDSDLDLVVANGGIPVLDPPKDIQDMQFFLNLTAQGLPGQFQDMTELAGFNQIEPLLGRGLAAADYDNDGDIDFAVNTIGGPLTLFRNETASGNWLSIEAGNSEPGALVSISLSNGQTHACEIHAGSSYLSGEDNRCHFGLGGDATVLEARVRWLDGAEAVLHDLAANQFVRIAKPVSSPAQIAASDESAEDFLFRVNLRRGGAEPMRVLPKASPAVLKLGEALFWDRELSGNRDVSCATCHHPAAATGDGLSLSVGVGGTGAISDRQLGEDREWVPRNATEIFNRGVAGWEAIFWDGRVALGHDDDDFMSPAGDGIPADMDNVIAVQALFPVTSRTEMRGEYGDVDVFGQRNELAGFSENDFRRIWEALTARLMAIPEYRQLFADAYPETPEGWHRYWHGANAIAAYEMAAFTFDDAPWDRYLNGDETALSDEALRGAKLFYGDAGCSRCHSGSLLTDQLFHNIGVPQFGPGKDDDAPHDYGRWNVSRSGKEMSAFRTPPLRNVTLTGPWMHDGAYADLEETVRHHLDPAKALADYDKTQIDPLLQDTLLDNYTILRDLDLMMAQPIELSESEIADLMAFLEALTSPSAIDLCDLIPDSVPSGLPVDSAPPDVCTG